MSTIAMSGIVRADLQQQVVSCATLSDDLESLVGEQAGDALAKEHRVVGEGDANRWLGLLGIGELGVDAPYCHRNQSSLWEMSRFSAST